MDILEEEEEERKQIDTEDVSLLCVIIYCFWASKYFSSACKTV